jgi:hypothetical protein
MASIVVLSMALVGESRTCNIIEREAFQVYLTVSRPAFSTLATNFCNTPCTMMLNDYDNTN